MSAKMLSGSLQCWTVCTAVKYTPWQTNRQIWTLLSPVCEFKTTQSPFFQGFGIVLRSAFASCLSVSLFKHCQHQLNTFIHYALWCYESLQPSSMDLLTQKHWWGWQWWWLMGRWSGFSTQNCSYVWQIRINISFTVFCSVATEQHIIHAACLSKVLMELSWLPFQSLCKQLHIFLDASLQTAQRKHLEKNRSICNT